MRITQSKDGLPRFTLKVETRVSLYDMAIYLLTAWRFETDLQTHYRPDETNETFQSRIENRLKDLMASSTSKELLSAVRDVILVDGTETPHYTVSDGGLGDHTDFLCGLLSRRFTRFQNPLEVSK